MSVVTVTIFSGGSAIPAEIEVLAVDIRRELDRIPSARLLLADGNIAERKWPLSDGKLFAPGAEVEIKARWEGESGSEETLFKGLVVRHTIEADARLGTQLRVELKDKAVVLASGRKSTVFNDMTDSDAAKKLISDAGLSAATIDASEYQHKALVQYQCSDWDFLLSRAQAIGRLVAVTDGKIALRKPAVSDAAKVKVRYGIDEVYDIAFEVDALAQRPAASAIAWDPKNQAALEVKAAEPPALGQGVDTGKKAAGAIGFGARTLMHAAPFEKPDLQAWADGQLGRSRMALLRGRVSLLGTGKVALLDVVELEGFGKRFDGKAPVSGIAQRIDAQGWRTDLQLGFVDSGLIDDDAASVAAAAAQLPAVPGLQIGIVVAVQDDPDKAMRVRLKLPALGAQAPEVWSRWAFPDAGNERGMIFWPEPGDEVVVGFFGGDPRHPVVLGSLFSQKQPPPAPYDKPDDKNLPRGFFTKSGCEIGFIDDSKPKLFLRTKDKREITLDDDGKLISLADGSGNKLTIDDNGITIHSAKKLVLEADGDVEIKGSKIDLK